MAARAGKKASVDASIGIDLGGTKIEGIVLDDSGVMNEGGLRRPDEFVRHKVLDLLGDLALIGHPIVGHVRVERGGHGIHHGLLQKLREQPDAWQLVAGETPRSRTGVPAASVSPS